MSDAKFASITSALLARKGEAAPSLIGATVTPLPAREMRKAPQREMPAREPRTAALRPVIQRHTDTQEQRDRKRRVVVTLTSEEFQRLGVIAAKKDSTRHDMVRDVLFAELDAYARDQAAECRCISSGAACDCAVASDSGDPDVPAFGNL